MPHYSIPINKTTLCWAEIDHEGTIEEAIEQVKDEIKSRSIIANDLTEGFDGEDLEYEPTGEHYCDEQEVDSPLKTQLKTKYKEFTKQ